MAVATLDPPDDDRPSWPDPGLDELASAQARRFRLIGRAWDQVAYEPVHRDREAERSRMEQVPGYLEARQEEAPALPVRTD